MASYSNVRPQVKESIQVKDYPATLEGIFNRCKDTPTSVTLRDYSESHFYTPNYMEYIKFGYKALVIEGTTNHSVVVIFRQHNRYIRRCMSFKHFYSEYFSRKIEG